ncbi:tyrosine-protein phosphatase 10D-like [Liolophura sinensis]|uniref:tyrosine-protein phosphatase 10D-like n=1 Tax=Liolophura sinensis TaxID=3198878 RepID=UPI003158D199
MAPLCGEFTDIEEYWPYRIRVRASTKAGDGPSSDSEEFRTPEAAPGRVTNLHFIVLDGLLTSVNVTWEPPKLRDRNANITSFVLKYRAKVSDNVTSFTIPWSQSDNEVYSKVVKVEPGEEYNVSLVAVSKRFMGEILYVEYLAPRGPPPVPTECVICPDVSTKKTVPQSVQIFQLNLRMDFFTDDTNGKIVDSGLIVIQTSSVEGESTSKSLADTFYMNYAKWHEANSKDFTIPYRATPVDWYIRRDIMSRSEGETGSFRYTVGNDGNCTESIDTFCNGPLKPATKYSVKAFSCTHGGCTETEYKSGYQTSEASPLQEPYVTVAAAVSASCGVLIIVTIVLVVVLFKRARRQKNRERTPSDSGSDSDCPVPFTPIVKQPLDDLQTANPIPLAELFQTVEELHRDSNLAYSRQYLWLKERSPKLPVTAAVLNDNMLKNRYIDVLPFDDTRVKLLPVEDDEASDYINANYIPGYHSQREYIAAQGPLETTVEDFWRMIWEQKVTIIVMLTKVKEKGMVKCVQYWQDEDGNHEYGNIAVERLSYSNLNTYELREFTITNIHDTTVRKIKHFQFLTWPDFGVSNCEDMVNFLQDVRSHVRPNMSGPLLVHCR